MRAACRGVDGNLFFRPERRYREAALLVCAGCSVTEECLSYALDTGQTMGIWGGKDAEERALLT